MGKLAIVLVSMAALLSGCGSFNGYGLMPGSSGEADVVALMGTPSQKVALPNGDSALYFSRLPEGRAVFVVRVGPNGVMKSIEQRLNRANLKMIFAGTSTMKEVRELFGPPGKEGSLERQARTWWEYKYFDVDQRRVIWVQFSGDGVVREVLDMLDWEWEKPSSLFGMP